MLEETLNEWWNGALERGRREGRTEGRTKGCTEGRQEGQVEGKRQLLLQLLEQRFGVLPRGMRRRLNAISSAQELADLAQRVLVAASLEEMGLG